MGDTEPACGSFQKELCFRQVQSSFKLWDENRNMQLVYNFVPAFILFFLQRPSHPKQWKDSPSLPVLSIWDAKFLEICVRQHMNQAHKNLSLMSLIQKFRGGRGGGRKERS